MADFEGDNGSSRRASGDGLVIGGCAHGDQWDPMTRGPEVCVPKRRPLTDADCMPLSRATKSIDDSVSIERYHIHPFRNGTHEVSLYMPAHVKAEQALAYLVNNALRAPRV